MDAHNYNAEELVDIKTINIDKSLSKEEKIKEFLRQIKNPNKFRCGKFTVSVKYAQNNITMEDCMRQILD